MDCCVFQACTVFEKENEVLVVPNSLLLSVPPCKCVVPKYVSLEKQLNEQLGSCLKSILPALQRAREKYTEWLRDAVIVLRKVLSLFSVNYVREKVETLHKVKLTVAYAGLYVVVFGLEDGEVIYIGKSGTYAERVFRTMKRIVESVKEKGITCIGSYCISKDSRLLYAMKGNYVYTLLNEEDYEKLAQVVSRCTSDVVPYVELFHDFEITRLGTIHRGPISGFNPYMQERKMTLTEYILKHVNPPKSWHEAYFAYPYIVFRHYDEYHIRKLKYAIPPMYYITAVEQIALYSPQFVVPRAVQFNFNIDGQTVNNYTITDCNSEERVKLWLHVYYGDITGKRVFVGYVFGKPPYLSPSYLRFYSVRQEFRKTVSEEKLARLEREVVSLGESAEKELRDSDCDTELCSLLMKLGGAYRVACKHGEWKLCVYKFMWDNFYVFTLSK